MSCWMASVSSVLLRIFDQFVVAVDGVVGLLCGCKCFIFGGIFGGFQFLRLQQNQTKTNRSSLLICVGTDATCNQQLCNKVQW